MKHHYLLLLLGCLSGGLIDAKPLTCNERMRHGPRGVAQGLAAIAGCIALYKAKNDIVRSSEAKCGSSFENFQKYTFVGMTVAVYSGWIYYFASSAAESLKIFFTDDKESEKNDLLAEILRQKDLSKK